MGNELKVLGKVSKSTQLSVSADKGFEDYRGKGIGTAMNKIELYEA